MATHSYVCKKCGKQFESPKKNKKYCSHNCFAKRFSPVTKACETCDKEFTVAYRFRGQKTCGMECAKTAISKTLTTRETKRCLECGKEFEVTQSYKDRGKYCSTDCFYKHRYHRDSKTVTLTCENCGKEFEKPFTHRGRRFCGYSCANSGENNGMYGKPGSMTGKPAWSRGLTAKTDPRLRALGEKISAIISQKMVDGSWSPPSTGFKGEHYVGIKNDNQEVYLRSSYESAYVRILDEDDDVISWEYEPMRIPYVFEGSIHNYVPDFLVNFYDGTSTLIEVKPACLTETPTSLVKLKAANSWCAMNDIGLLVITEQELSQ